jgi:hypothetical protein
MPDPGQGGCQCPQQVSVNRVRQLIGLLFPVRSEAKKEM